jgi:hypothetical protein
MQPMTDLRSKLVYLAAPYSDPDPAVIEQRMRTICEIDAHLVAAGIYTVTPLSKHFILGFRDLPGNWAYWGDYCRALLPRCDAMILIPLPGWESSSGVRGELDIALGRMPVYSWDTSLGSLVEFFD